MQDIKKYIYFPPSHVPNRAPIMVYVWESWGENLKGSQREEDFQEGRFRFFPARRCQIHSPALWDECMRWMSDRDLVEARFDELMKKGVDDVNRKDIQVSDL